MRKTIFQGFAIVAAFAAMLITGIAVKSAVGPDGIATAPAIYGSDPTTGIHYVPQTSVNLDVAGVTVLTAKSGVVTVGALCTGSGATPQTCNGQRGVVTTASLSTAAATATTYVINNNAVTTASVIDCFSQGYSGTYVTNGYPELLECKPGAGTITVGVVNTHAANALSGTIAIGFVVAN